MIAPHDVISAFLDDEPFDARELADALADPAGRTLLLDLVALRHIVQTDDGVPIRRVKESRSVMRFAAAAAVLVALTGGYMVGARRAVSPPPAEAPAPTRVVQSTTDWQDVTGGVR